MATATKKKKAKAPPFSLGAVEMEIFQLLNHQKDAIVRVAELMLQAKRHGPFASTKDWLTWGKETFSFSRRYCFTLAKVSGYLEAIKAVDPSLLAPGYFGTAPLPGSSEVQHAALGLGLATDITKLEILSRIPVQKLGKFLKAYDLQEMEREDLRSAVYSFLGIPQVERFRSYASMPPPEQLLLGLADEASRGKIDPAIEVQYLRGRCQRIGLALDKMKEKEILRLAKDLEDTVKALQQEVFVNRKGAQ